MGNKDITIAIIYRFMTISRTFINIFITLVSPMLVDIVITILQMMKPKLREAK